MSSNTTAPGDATSVSISPPLARARRSRRARLGFRPDLDREAALELGALALYEAGDNDPSTGGADFVRNLFPMMVTITEQGFQELASDEVGERFRAINERRTQSGGVAGGTLR